MTLPPPMHPGDVSPPILHPTVIPAELVPERRGAVAFWSHQRREGDWILPRQFRAVAFMGNVEIDLTSARVGPGTSHIEVMSFMGNITILVPPDLRIDVDGDPMLGSFEVKREAASTTSLDSPLIRITGSAVVGSVDVKIVDPNAPGWFEKLRMRWAEKRREL